MAETYKEPSELITKLLNEKKSAREFQIRKHADWDENYELYRNKVKVNRLTQRQAVNIPLMKETVKTILSRIDDAPSVDWKEKSGDEMKELIYQEIWNDQFKKEKLEWKDVQDKKNVLLYGISSKHFNIEPTGVSIDVLDVYDVVYDPLMNPMDVETARFIVKQNIFRTLRDILADDRYSEKGKDELKDWLSSENGIVQSGKNKEEWEKKLERLKAMDINSPRFSLFQGGDVIVSMTEHYTEVWDEKSKSMKRYVVVYADDCIELLNEPLEELIGVTFWPFVFWSEDMETNDIYPDSVADLVRTPNKILNVWFSQMVESRTLQNFGMHWYDATVQGYQPQTYEPGPGRMLPAPGDPNKTIMPVAMNGLDETMNAITFLTTIVERGTGATAIEKGQSEGGQQTLGEIQILVGKAGERSKAISKFYRGSWYETAKKWDGLMQANNFKKFKLYKTGRKGKVYEKIVGKDEWKSEAGYEPTVASSSEQEQEQIKSLQRWGYVTMQNPNNAILKKIAQKRQLESLDLTPQELADVEAEEERLIEMAQTQPMMAQQAPNPQEQQMQATGQSINQSLQALAQP